MQEQFQDAKVLIFKKRRRKNSRRLTGHRQVWDLILESFPLSVLSCHSKLLHVQHCLQVSYGSAMSLTSYEPLTVGNVTSSTEHWHRHDTKSCHCRILHQSGSLTLRALRQSQPSTHLTPRQSSRRQKLHRHHSVQTAEHLIELDTFQDDKERASSWKTLDPWVNLFLERKD